MLIAAKRKVSKLKEAGTPPGGKYSLAFIQSHLNLRSMLHRPFIHTSIAMFAIMISAIPLQAAENTHGWSNNIELGAVRTAGNTQTLVVNSKVKLVREGSRLRDTITGSANNSSDRNTTTAETYKASFQEDWKISERDYLFVRYGFESDRFSGFRRRFSETLGYGRELIKTETLRWNIEIGGGLRQTHLTDRSKTSEAIGRAASGINWKISDSATFGQDLSTEGGVKGWSSKSSTFLQHKLNSHLASKISLELEHNSKVPATRKKLDIETAITMVISF